MADKFHDLSDALIGLRSAGVPVVERQYGFDIAHPEFDATKSFMSCGRDNDFSISVSVHHPAGKPNVWFFRFDFSEMAEFLISAYQDAGTAPSTQQIIDSLHEFNQDYDAAALKVRLDNWHRENGYKSPDEYPSDVKRLT